MEASKAAHHHEKTKARNANKSHFWIFGHKESYRTANNWILGSRAY